MSRQELPLSYLLCVRQAIIFQDGRAIGRSGKVRLFSCPTAEASLSISADSLAVESFAVQLDAWLPSWKTAAEDSSPLYIAVDEAFTSSTFRVQLIGRTRQGKNFALPFAYQFTGAFVCSRLDYFDQYVRRHQENRRSSAQTPLSCEHAINFGALKLLYDWKASSLSTSSCLTFPVPDRTLKSSVLCIRIMWWCYRADAFNDVHTHRLPVQRRACKASQLCSTSLTSPTG